MPTATLPHTVSGLRSIDVRCHAGEVVLRWCCYARFITWLDHGGRGERMGVQHCQSQCGRFYGPTLSWNRQAAPARYVEDPLSASCVYCGGCLFADIPEVDHACSCVVEPELFSIQCSFKLASAAPQPARPNPKSTTMHPASAPH